ncbi:MAG: hemolysin family protein [Rhodospirillales bacterium]|nr:hemolysin family protein [Rhodospirillales bacterium]
MEILITVLVIIAFLAMEAFFSGSEIAVVSADRIKLRHNAANGSRGAKLALKMLENPEWLLSTTLTGTNVAVVTNTTVATTLVVHLLGESYSWVAVVAIAPLIWIFGEIVAKSVFQQRANDITPIAIFGLRFFSILFWPILWTFAMISRTLSRALGGHAGNPFTLREEIRTFIEMSPVSGDILPEEKTMIRRVFDFSETTAGEIMVPLIDVVGIERGASCGEAIRCSVESQHKRLPVFDERIDRISGSLNTLDILLQEGDKLIEPFIRPVVYVPASKSIGDLLVEFSKRDVTAVVVDEFGGSEGIVMLEDVLEEVVGELEDEFDDNIAGQPLIRQIDRNHAIMSARVEIDAVNDTLDLSLPEGDYETVAGFLISLTGEIPAIGDVIKHKDITFTVTRATPQAIQEVRVRW